LTAVEAVLTCHSRIVKHYRWHNTEIVIDNGRTKEPWKWPAVPEIDAELLAALEGAAAFLLEELDRRRDDFDRPPADVVQDTPVGGPADAPTKGRTSRKKTRDPKMEARDNWIYQQCCQTKPRLTHDEIVGELKKVAPQRGWEIVESKQGIRQAAIEYARRHNRPAPPRRQDAE
jgi:hypothetical protein